MCSDKKFRKWVGKINSGNMVVKVERVFNAQTMS